MLLPSPHAWFLVVRILADILRDTLFDALALKPFEGALNVLVLSELDKYHYYHNLCNGIPGS